MTVAGQVGNIAVLFSVLSPNLALRILIVMFSLTEVGEFPARNVVLLSSLGISNLTSWRFGLRARLLLTRSAAMCARSWPRSSLEFVFLVFMRDCLRPGR